EPLAAVDLVVRDDVEGAAAETLDELDEVGTVEAEDVDAGVAELLHGEVDDGVVGAEDGLHGVTGDGAGAEVVRVLLREPSELVAGVGVEGRRLVVVDGAAVARRDASVAREEDDVGLPKRGTALRPSPLVLGLLDVAPVERKRVKNGAGVAGGRRLLLAEPVGDGGLRGTDGLGELALRHVPLAEGARDGLGEAGAADGP